MRKKTKCTVDNQYIVDNPTELLSGLGKGIKLKGTVKES